MATHTDNGDLPEKNKKTTEVGSKQTIGAIAGIIVLLALLFIGVSRTKPAGAELITEEAKPDQSTYMEAADSIDYETALLKDYDSGKLLELSGDIHKVFAEPIKGEQSILFDMKQETVQGASTDTKKQVILILVEKPVDVESSQQAHIFGRYIGTLEYETTLGTSQEVPAIQVDYLDIRG